MKQGKVVAVIMGCLFSIGLIAMPAQTGAKEKIRFLFPTVSYTVWNNNVTIGLPKSQGGLGFFEEEGLDVKVNGARGSIGALKILGAGTVDAAGAVGYGPMLRAIGQGMPVISCFAAGMKNNQAIVVLEDSPIKRIEDLRGKKIGVYSMGSSSVYIAKAMAKEVGLDPEKDIELVPIGLGARALKAIMDGEVAGAAFWDTANASMEVRGAKLRYLITPGMERILSAGFVVNTSWLQNNRSTAVKFFRAIAKNEVFRKANVIASIKIHWKLFPQTKPSGVPEEKALKDMIHVLMARLKGNPDLSDWRGKVGMIPEVRWQPTMDFAFDNGIIKKKLPLAKAFTNELIAEANNFNMDRIIEMAKNYKP